MLYARDATRRLGYTSLVLQRNGAATLFLIFVFPAVEPFSREAQRAFPFIIAAAAALSSSVSSC